MSAPLSKRTCSASSTDPNNADAFEKDEQNIPEELLKKILGLLTDTASSTCHLTAIAPINRYTLNSKRTRKAMGGRK